MVNYFVGLLLILPVRFKDPTGYTKSIYKRKRNFNRIYSLVMLGSKMQIIFYNIMLNMKIILQNLTITELKNWQ